MNNLLEIKNVVKTYGDFTALNNVSLTIPRGSVFGLLGPNGAGKTSLIRIINQITMQDTGEVYFDGKLLAPNDVDILVTQICAEVHITFSLQDDFLLSRFGGSGVLATCAIF